VGKCVDNSLMRSGMGLSPSTVNALYERGSCCGVTGFPCASRSVRAGLRVFLCGEGELVVALCAVVLSPSLMCGASLWGLLFIVCADCCSPMRVLSLYGNNAYLRRGREALLAIVCSSAIL